MTNETLTDAPSAHRPRVLIADPDAASRAEAERACAAAGLDVVSAANADAVLREFLRRTPDVALIDLACPPKGGLALAKALRQLEAGTGLPLVFRGSDEDIAEFEHTNDLGIFTLTGRENSWTFAAAQLRLMLRAVKGRRVYEALRRSERRNEALVQALPDMLFILNENDIVQEQLGRMRSAVDGEVVNYVGRSMAEVLPPDVAVQAHHHLQLLRSTGSMQTFENQLGGEHFFETRLIELQDRTVLVIVRDITEWRRTEARIHRLAYCDELTGLPNREQFKRNLKTVLAQARESSSPLALLHLGLDRFKRINETLGRSAGDELLKSVAKRLAGGIRKETRSRSSGGSSAERTWLARVGGDEFALLVPGIDGEQAAEALANRIKSLVSAGYVHGRHRLVITPSIGVALFPGHATTADDLLRAADTALTLAKAGGRNCCQLFSAGMIARSLERLEIESDIRAALKKNEFLLYYQPKVELATWSIVGAEALLRWRHPQRGWIPPGEFIPVAEESGLIKLLGYWVLREACRKLREWQMRGLPISLAINVSSEEFNQPDFAAKVLEVVRRSGVDASGLELEITESLLMRNTDGTVETLRKLRAAGLGLAVDDFGTGYSSLSYLQEFPVHAVKIDQSFIRDLHKSRDNAAIVAAILAMARELRLKVVAEGVETEEQLEYLRSHGCDQIQGFLYSKPLPAREFEALLAAAGQIAPEKAAG